MVWGNKHPESKGTNYLQHQLPSNHELITLPKTNIAPENGPSQKETSIPTIHFQVLLVSGGV